MAKRFRKLGGRSRTINAGSATSKDIKEANVRSAQERFVFQHAKYDIIIGSLQEGVAVAEIARWFADQGWLEIKERTFRDYLLTFKRRNPNLIKGGAEDSIDSIVDAHRPNASYVTELQRLLRLQKIRLKIDVSIEKDLGKLFNTTVKEIAETREILAALAKAEGTDIGSIAPGKVSGEVGDSIRKMQTNEAEHDRMYHLTEQLVGAMSDAQKEKEKVQDTA